MTNGPSEPVWFKVPVYAGLTPDQEVDLALALERTVRNYLAGLRTDSESDTGKLLINAGYTPEEWRGWTRTEGELESDA